MQVQSGVPRHSVTPLPQCPATQAARAMARRGQQCDRAGSHLLGVVKGGLPGRGTLSWVLKPRRCPPEEWKRARREAKAQMHVCGGLRTRCSLLEESWEEFTFLD